MEFYREKISVWWIDMRYFDLLFYYSDDLRSTILRSRFTRMKGEERLNSIFRSRITARVISYQVLRM